MQKRHTELSRRTISSSGANCSGGLESSVTIHGESRSFRSGTKVNSSDMGHRDSAECETLRVFRVRPKLVTKLPTAQAEAGGKVIPDRAGLRKQEDDFDRQIYRTPAVNLDRDDFV